MQSSDAQNVIFIEKSKILVDPIPVHFNLIGCYGLMPFLHLIILLWTFYCRSWKMSKPGYTWFSFFGSRKKNWTNSPIHTFDVEAGILPASSLYSNIGGTPLSPCCHNTLIRATAYRLQCRSNLHFPLMMFVRSWLIKFS